MLLDILLPKSCLGCNRLGTYLCWQCRSQLVFIENDGCLYCDKRTDHGLTHPKCHRSHGLDGVISMLYYTPLMKKIIKEIKYHLVYDAVAELFWSLDPIIAAKVAIWSKKQADISLLPLPLHTKRLKERGFNQAELIAAFFAPLMQVPVAHYLQRVKYTSQQARQSSRWQRYLNTRNAFQLIHRDAVNGKSVIIVDDVITSGSTIKEVARTLKKNGCREVFALSLTRD